MALNNIGLGIVIRSRDLASKNITKLATKFLGLEDAMKLGRDEMGRFTQGTNPLRAAIKSIGIGVGVAVAGFLGLKAAFSFAGASAEFTQSLTAIGLISGATTQEMKLLRDTAIQAGVATQFSPTEAVEGLTALAKAGLSAGESMAVLSPALNLAAGSLGELGVEQSAQLATQAMKAFGVSSDDVGFAIDKMIATTQSFNISAKDLPLAFGVASRGAQALNATLDDTAISLGLVKNVMPSVERASTSVAVSMERLASAQNQQKLETLFGVQAVNKQTGEFRPWLDIVGDIAERSMTMTSAQKAANLQMVFGQRAAGGISAIMTQLTNGIKDNEGAVLKGATAIAFLRAEMKASAGTAQEFADAMNATFAGQKRQLQGTIDTIKVVFGEAFEEALTPVVRELRLALNFLLEGFLALPDSIKKAFAGGFILIAVTAIVVGLIIAVKGLIVILAAAGVTISAILSPLLIVVAVIAAVVGAVFLFRKAWQENFGGIRQATAIFAAFFVGVWEGIKAAVAPVFESFQFAFAQVGEAFQEVSQVFKEVFGTIADALGFSTSSMGDAEDKATGFGEVIGFLVGTPLTLLGNILALGITLWAEWIKQIVRVARTIGGFLAPVFSALGTVVGAVLDSIILQMQFMIEVVVGSINSLIELVNFALDGAAKAAFVLAPTRDLANQAAAAISSAKIGVIEAPDITGVKGSVSEGLSSAVAGLGELLRSRGQEIREVGTGAGAGLVAGNAGADSPAIPGTKGSQGLTSREIAVGVEMALRTVEGEREQVPIVIEGRVNIDGRDAGDILKDDRKEQASRRGNFRPIFGGFGG